MPVMRARSPWLPAFVFSLLAFAASLGVLGYVVLVAVTEEDDIATTPVVVESPGGTPVVVSNVALTFEGRAPSRMDIPDFRPVSFDDKGPDITFEPNPPTTAPAHRWFVPVVPLETGVTALTRAQLEGIV